MKKLEIYDPALCCSTGVCGPSPDSALSEFASALKLLRDKAEAVRYNLAQEPGAFAANPLVKGILERDGTEALPVVLVDGKLVMTGVYPSAVQLKQLLGLSPSCCGEEEDCCSGATEVHSSMNEGCCGENSCCEESK
ncbi:MAG: arsenite efflux transporter metallochaperone ArsD [Puniceicoccales bacterium]